MAPPKPTLVGSLLRIVAATLSAGGALVSILSYTGMSASVAGGDEGPPPAATRAHRLSLAPLADTAAALGDSIQLAALVTDNRGGALLGIAPVWTSADPAVVEVDQAGTVVSRARGTSLVIVRVGELEARARITVEPRPAAIEAGDTLLRVLEGERIVATAVATDARGHPIAGAPLRWHAADAAVAAVDSLGEVTGVSPGRGGVTVSLGELRAEVGVEVVPVPTSITVLTGEEQRGPAGRALTVPVTAQIVSRTGRPIPGAAASFRTRGAAGVEPAVDTADARGMVSAVWTLDPIPGRQQLTIAVDGVTVVPTVTAEADPVPANAKVALASELVSGTAGDSLTEPVAIRVTDSTGMALADLPVAWTALDGGRLTPLGARTDSLGEARALWRLGPRAGRQRIRVQVGNARTMPAFVAGGVALAGAAESLAVRGGDRQTARAGTALARPIVLRVMDRAGNPVAGVPLTAVPGAGSVGDSVARTDSSGTARLRWTLGRAAGPQTLTVSLGQAKPRLELTANATAGPPAKAGFVAPPASATAGRPLASGVTAEVTDGFGNPVAGQRITLATTSGTLSPARGTTDRAGRLKVKWTPGKKPGPATLSAGVTGSQVRARQTVGVTAPRAPRD